VTGIEQAGDRERWRANPPSRPRLNALRACAMSTQHANTMIAAKVRTANVFQHHEADLAAIDAFLATG